MCTCEHVSSSRYAASVGAVYVEASAKQNKGIEELFLDICKREPVRDCTASWLLDMSDRKCTCHRSSLLHMHSLATWHTFCVLFETSTDSFAFLLYTVNVTE